MQSYSRLRSGWGFQEDYDPHTEDFARSNWRHDQWRSADRTTGRTVFSPNEDSSASLQTKGFRRQIDQSAVGQLVPGDHVAWRRTRWYTPIWHHAIVVDVDTKNKRLCVIHYVLDGVKKKWLNIDEENGDMFLIRYRNEDPPEEVLRRAKLRLNENRYNVISNNCEHLATYCKTGTANSQQVRFGLRHLELSIVGSSLYKWGTWAMNRIFIPLTKLVKVSVRASSVGLVSLFEAGQCIYDTYQTKKCKADGEMSQKDFEETTTETTTMAVSSTIGTVVGDMVGSTISSVGTAVCGFVGSVVGSLIGKFVGLSLGRWLGSF